MSDITDPEIVVAATPGDSSSDDDDGTELGGSELGTKEFWDKSYDREIANYRTHGDVGEVWFDEDSQTRVINWMLKRELADDVSIIDLGMTTPRIVYL